MKSTKFRLAVACLIVFAVTVPFAHSQESPSSESAAVSAPAASETETRLSLELKSQSEAAKGLKVEKTFLKRLPNFYKDVVSSDQKEQIYNIQETYFAVISMLELRLEKLKAERDARIEAVLTESQKTKLESVKKAAATSRAKK
ncbi:MAG: hypothetical protein LBQ54_01810 [Planctomycetaceae bacterium]|jgi:hypothetical protein|nr:hypothetical protein [Planctomycetaceae bacterium]